MEKRFKNSFIQLSLLFKFSRCLKTCKCLQAIHILFVNDQQIMEDNTNPRQVCGQSIAKLSIGMENKRKIFAEKWSNEEMCE